MTNNPWLAEFPALVVLGMGRMERISRRIKIGGDSEGRGGRRYELIAYDNRRGGEFSIESGKNRKIGRAAT